MSNPNTRYRYYGLEHIDMPRDERPYYCRFAVYECETGRNLVEFYTNRDLEGRFTFDEKSNTYRQTRGTWQFSMAGIKRQAAMTRLRKEADGAREYRDSMGC